MSSRGKQLSFKEKNRLVQFLFEGNVNGKPTYGKINEAASNFKVCRQTVTCLWIAAKKQYDEGKPILLSSNRLGVPIRKLHVLDEEKLKSIEFQKRSTLRCCAEEMGVGKDTVRRWIKQRLIRPHTNAINPQLTDANKTLRMKYALSQLHVDREAKKIKFKSMHNVIHTDEKWFISLNQATVGRPLYSSDGTCLFDGKIGIFPFTEQVAAQRNSKNRVKGTMVTKNIESITKNVIKDCIITQVIPALKSKWPANASKDIYIQQDNAKPHIHDSDQDFRAIACADGFNIKLICQPPNSSDTNINDLGWFRSIQSLQQRKKSKNVEDLVQNVKLSFEELTDVTLNKIFLSLQATCVEIIKCKGHNNYKMPHIGKNRLMNEGRLPTCLEVDEEIVCECIAHLLNNESNIGGTFDVQPLMTDLGM